MSRDNYCRNCEATIDGLAGSLPVDNNADFVAVDFAGEWGGVPACMDCVRIHAAAGPHGPAVLELYAKAVEQLHARIREARELFDKIQRLASDGEEV